MPQIEVIPRWGQKTIRTIPYRKWLSQRNNTISYQRVGTGDVFGALVGTASLISAIGSATATTLGTLKTLDLAEEKQKLEKEILLRQLKIQEGLKEKEKELLSLQIEGAEAQQSINIEVSRAIGDAQQAQATTVLLEEQIKQELLRKRLLEVKPDIVFTQESGQSNNIPPQNTVPQGNGNNLVKMVENGKKKSNMGIVVGVGGVFIAGVLTYIFLRKKEK